MWKNIDAKRIMPHYVFLNPQNFFHNSEPLSNAIMFWQLFVVFAYMFITKTLIEIISKFPPQKNHNFIISNLFYIEWEQPQSTPCLGTKDT